MKKYLLKLSAFSAVAALGITTAMAQTSGDWTGATSGNLSTSTNWTPNATPSSTFTGNFNSANYTNTANSTAASFGKLYFGSGNTNGITFGSSNGILTLSGVSGVGIQMDSGSGAVSTGAARFTLAGNQTWQNDSTSSSFTANGSITNGGFFLTANGSGTTVLGVGANIAGTGGIVKNGTGRLTLSSSTSSYSGGVTLNAGILDITNSSGLTSALGNSTTSVLTINGGSVDCSGASARSYTNPMILNADLNYISTTANITLNGATTLNGTRSVTVGASWLLTMGGVISDGGSAYGLTKEGAGTLALNGAGANTYTGNTTLNAGVLNLGANNKLADSSNIIVNGGRLDLTLGTGTVETVANVTVTGGYISGSGNGTLNKLNATNGFNFQNADNAISVNLGGGNITKTTGGTVTLSGNNTNTGGLTVDGGTLILSKKTSLYGGVEASWIKSNMTVNSGGTLTFSIGGATDFSTANVTTLLANLTGNVTAGGFKGGSTLGLSVSLAAIVADAIADTTGTGGGVISLFKSGTTLTLTGNNTYTGDTTISAGTLTIGAGGRLGGGNYAGNIINNGTLTFSATTPQTLSGIISGTGALTNTTGQVITLSGNNTYSGGSVLSTSNFVLSHKNALGAGLITTSSAPVISAGLDLSGVNAIANNVAMGGGLTISGSNNMTLSGNITLDANRQISVTNTAATVLSGPIHLTDGVGGSGNLTFSISNNNSVTVSGVIDDGGTARGVTYVLTVGTVLKLTNTANSYTGATLGTGTANAVLEVSKLANGGNASSIGASGNAASNLSISQSGTLRYVGSGDSTDRLFTLNGGNNTFDYLDSSGSGAINFTNNGTLAHAGPTSQNRTLVLTGTNTGANTLTPAIANNGAGGIVSLNKTGTGNWILAGSNTYNGTTAVSAGALQSAKDAALSTTSGVTVTNPGSTLGVNFGGGSDYSEAQVVTLLAKTTYSANATGIFAFDTTNGNGTYGTAFAKTSGLAKLGANTLTLTANNTYNGTTTISSGTLLVSGAGSINKTTGINVASGSTLRYNSTVAYTGGAIANSGVIAGSGNLGTTVLGGSGSIDPGNSPGILTAGSTNPTSGLDYNFEFTLKNANPTWNNSSASGNDVLRLTGGTPFSSALGGTNTISLYLNVGSLAANDVFTGGFYTDASSSFLSSISGAQFRYYLYNASGGTTYNGLNYDLYAGSLTFNVATVSLSADFGSGLINGYSMQFTAVPEPATWALLAFSLTTVMVMRRRRRD